MRWVYCSFFKWFYDTQQKEAMDSLQDEFAEVIKDDLWPNPLKYFNNEQDEDEYEDDVEEDEEDAVSATLISLCFSILLVKVWRFCTGLTEKFVSAFNISRVLC
jgi:hypothetical protein